MDDYNSLRSQDIMTASIFSFLENLLAAVRTSETLASEAQERDQINVSNDIKPGGYSEDIFIFLSEREKEEYTCCVCYLVIKDAHQCSNGHKFCYSCIYVWSTCNRTGADCCPACRCEGIYARNEQINEKICAKRVKCKDDGCNWRGFLRDYIEHEHRHYEFKELSRSIDLPNINSYESVRVVTPPSLPATESSDIDKTSVDNTQTSSQTETNSNPLSTNISQSLETGISNFYRTGVSRVSIAPRRLSRLSDTGPNIVRTAGPRSIVHSNSRQATVYPSRCPNYHPRPPRTSRTSRPNDQSVQATSVRPSDNIDARMNHNESTQTYIEESREDPISSMSVDNQAVRISRQDQSHSSLFPPINTSTRNSLSTDRPVMEYRRLAPTYASRRQNMGYLDDGHENFTRMLILLTSDLEDRIPGNRSQSRNPLSNSHQRNNGNLSVASVSDSNLSNNTTNRSTSRLQEFRNLNRRLSEVANSLDMLIESTSRQGATNISNDSSTSGTTSDTE